MPTESQGKKSSTVAGRELDWQDWNFDRVTEPELLACCYWEYARESTFIRDTLRRYRDWWKAGGHTDVPEAGELDAALCRIQEPIPYHSEVFLCGCAFDRDPISQSDDPDKPNYKHPHAPPITGSFPDSWQSLDEAERAHRAHIRSDREVIPLRAFERDGSRLTAEMLLERSQASLRDYIAIRDKLHRDNPGVGEGTLRRQGKYPDYRPSASVFWEGGAECLSVKIEWADFTNDEIVEAFRKWVGPNRPPDIPKPDGRGHKPKDLRADLTRLAAMRILSRYTPVEIIGNTRRPPLAECAPIHKTKQFASDKWGDPTKWRDARREASQRFRELFPFLPTDEKPLSWRRES